MNFALKLHILILIIAFILSGCNSTEKKGESKNILVDDLHREVQINLPAKRIVSLVPSITEILYAIGADSNVLAVSQACTYPTEAKNKKIVTTYPAINYEMIYSINPDLVLVSTEIFHQDIIHRFNELSVPVYFFTFTDKGDIYKAIEKMGEFTGKSSNALAITDSLERLLQSFKFAHTHDTHPKTLILVSYNPMMAVGKNSFLSDLLSIAGGTNMVTFDSPDPYPQVTREFILTADPEVILTSGGKNSTDELFYTFPELSKTKAYMNKSIFGIKSEAFVRPSTRFMEAIREMHGDLYGEK